MQRLIWTVLAAFAMAMVLGPRMLVWLKKLKFGQTIYELEPDSNKKKQGTPTMGGMIFAIPALIAAAAGSFFALALPAAFLRKTFGLFLVLLAVFTLAKNKA